LKGFDEAVELFEASASFGVTYAAGVAATYAAHHPDRVSRLVLWAPTGSGTDIGPPDQLKALLELVRGSWGTAPGVISDNVFPNGPLELRHWYADALRTSMSHNVAVHRLEYILGADYREVFRQVTTPTLILHRSDDHVVAVRYGRLWLP
jgi:pimeloyl-ACP methyl ester carboxylesterase